MDVAFKEWAVVCRAIADGRQTLLLRKGGIAEDGGVFRPEHSRFLLYPTYFHEPQAGGIRPEFLPLLDEVEANRPPAGVIRLTHIVDVLDVTFEENLDAILALADRHIWSEATVRQRFAYRRPGLYVLHIRPEALPTPLERPERPEYAGCKTWVNLTGV